MPLPLRSVERYYKNFGAHDGKYGPFLWEEDTRKSFETSYLEMKSRYAEQHKLLPITLADALSGLFSDDASIRDRMVSFWCSLDTDSRKEDASHDTIITSSPSPNPTISFDIHSNYPLIFTEKNGPVPVQIASRLNTYERTSPADASLGTGLEYEWTDERYANAILALRAIGSRPLYHTQHGQKKHMHASIKGRPFRACGDLLPWVNFGHGGSPWDMKEFGCRDCDAHTLIFSHIALAEQELENGFWTSDITPIPEYITILNNRRYKYEDFWRLIAQRPSQNHGADNTANAWGMAKLQYLDENMKQRYCGNNKKAQQVEKQMTLFKKRLNKGKETCSIGGSIVDQKRRKTISQTVAEDSDSDDDCVEYWDYLASQKSTSTSPASQSTLTSGSSTSQSRKRGCEQDDPVYISDSEGEFEVFRPFKKDKKNKSVRNR